MELYNFTDLLVLNMVINFSAQNNGMLWNSIQALHLFAIAY
jgi:hypothetical protein